VFAARNEMVLKKDDFSDVRISWQPKEQALKEIAEKLNIGLEHMVFVDDSPIECGRVAEALPMLTVIQLPKQPERFVSALLEDGFFDGLSLTEEDLARAEMYKQRDEAEALRASAGSIEEFYRQLNTEIEIAPVDKASLARASQMTQKTNQFNTTTIRFSEAEIAGRLADPNWVCATVRVKDRFGDSGITGLMMAHAEKDRMEIETFLLSCRVIGRGVETSMLAALREKANARALKRLSGKIVPTKRNIPVRNLYSDHAFKQVAGDGEGKPSEWEFDVGAPIVVPDWVSVVDKT
jgi:FkbH-like protein